MGLLDAISQEAGFDQPVKLTYMMLSYVRIFGETTGSEFFHQIELDSLRTPVSSY